MHKLLRDNNITCLNITKNVIKTNVQSYLT